MKDKQQAIFSQCIYCLKNKKKLEFNKEHVLQKSFGKFKNALTLENEVCRECNQSFGNEIDRILGRDSFESFCRLKYGIKHPEEAKDISYERLIITIPEEGQGDWAGVKVGYKPESLYLLSQLGFLQKNTEKYIYFTLLELKKGLHLKTHDIDKKADVKIVSNNKEEKRQLIAFLKDLKIPLGKEKEFTPIKTYDGKVEVKVEFAIDDILLRGIAKIGFNYMAWKCGGKFALKDDFNEIREYIQHGKLEPKRRDEIIKPSTEPFLADDSYKMRRFAHILCVQWDYYKRHIIAQVCIFNTITYTILLAENYSGIYQNIKSCHCYDLKNLEVKELQVINRDMLI